MYENLWDGRKLTMPETRKEKPLEASVSLSFSHSVYLFFNFFIIPSYFGKTLRCNTIAKLMFSLCHHVYLGSEEPVALYATPLVKPFPLNRLGKFLVSVLVSM